MYTPLYIKTDYSLLNSLIKIDDLIKKLKKLNITSCAICDDNLYGTMEFINKMNKNDIKPIIGLDIILDNNHILLYAENEIGYHNIVRIENIKNDRELTLNDLITYSNNLVCIVFTSSLFESLKQYFNHIFIGVSQSEESNFNSYKDNLVYVSKTLFLEEYEYKYLPYVYMIKSGKTISDGIEFNYQNNYLYNYDDLVNRLSFNTLNNTNKISDLCNIVFTKELYMPKYDVPDSKEYLKNLSLKGLYKRLNGNVTDIYLNRLNYELDIILNMHFEDYFLVVYDYIKYAKQNNILVGPGRGSAAGSLVSYCLGITEVDPIKYNLLFERFLNPERITMPDIDTDFPDTKREQVIDYVKSKYKETNVAGIITFGTLGGRQAVRDIGRVLNIDIKDIDYICKRLNFKESLKELVKRDKEIYKLIDSSDRFKLLYNIVNRIEGNKRHTSIHAAGIVISYKPLYEILPIIKNNSDDLYLTEYTMEYLEDIGLIKMDFLGIKNLSIIDNVINDINKELNLNINFNKIPLDDPKVMSLFYNGDTTGIFQFESDGMRKFLKDLKPKNFNDLCAAIALFRPGPAENIPSYIKRKEGKEKIDYIDESLYEILKDTYGIIIYQEQIMLIAQKLANYTLGEADILRRAMSKKKYDVLKQEENKFIDKSINNGYSKETSQEVFNLILKFANYGFNKSHSVSYTLVAYKMAYLKYYFPKYFYANLLKGVIGSEIKIKEYTNEIKKLGIKILPPSVNLSYDYKFRVLNEGIMFPIASIRNLGGVISNYIVEVRKDGFIDIFDFVKRTISKINNKKVIESLIYSHSLECFGYNINTLLNNIDSIINYIELTKEIDESIIPKPNIDVYEELDSDIILEKEKELFGMYITSHKTEKYKLNYSNIIDLSNIKENHNKNITIIVNVDRIKETLTKKGDNMAFISGSDNTGTLSITLFPDMYKNTRIKRNDIIKVFGRVERRFDEYQIIANNIEVL